MITAILFYLFATVLVGSAAAVVILRNPVHSVLFLILAFFNAAALFVMLGAEFLAMLLVIVYVGAVAVLFLFVVMMLNVNYESFRHSLNKYSSIGGVIAAFLLTQMIILFTQMQDIRPIKMKLAKPIATDVQNTEALGLVLYTDYFLLFQISGMILLVAMIGAIVLCFYPRQRLRRQNINAQVNRDPKTAIEIVKVETGKGVS